MTQTIPYLEYHPRIYTRDIVQFLMKQRDQVATTQKIAEEFFVPEYVARQGLERLRRVKRVDEFFPNMWHLE
jgi:hypothetical protein